MSLFANIVLLAIESSCDETAAAVCVGGVIKAHTVATQDIHKKYGGVVPEWASRLHIQALLPVVTEVLAQAQVSLKDVDYIAYTEEPGLMGCLLVGKNFARALSVALNKPALPVNHIYAHALANFIDNPGLTFPFLCLSVSGGHTQILHGLSPHTFHIIGETLDDAAGEAFDKIAYMLGLPYPGGALIDKYAEQGDPNTFVLPVPKVGGYDYSFSGLKTAVRYLIEGRRQKEADFIAKHLYDICASLRRHIVLILLTPFFKAAQNLGIRRVCLAGGVAANRLLRQKFSETATALGYASFIPDKAYCTDNAAMIAMSAYLCLNVGKSRAN